MFLSCLALIIEQLVTLCTGSVHHSAEHPAACDVSW